MHPGELRPPGPGIQTLDERLAEAQRLLLEDIRQGHAAGFPSDALVDEYCRLYAEKVSRKSGCWS